MKKVLTNRFLLEDQKNWHSIPLELKLDIFKYLDRGNLDKCQIVSRDLRKFVEDFSIEFGKHVILRFLLKDSFSMERNGDTRFYETITWLTKQDGKNEYRDHLETENDLRNMNILRLEITNLDDEKMSFLEKYTRNCRDSLLIKTLILSLNQSGIYAAVVVRNLIPALIFNVIQVEEVRIETNKRELSELILAFTAISRAPSCTKYFTLQLGNGRLRWHVDENQFFAMLQDPHVKEPNREMLILSKMVLTEEFVHQYFQLFLLHQNPSLLFHKMSLIVSEEILDMLIDFCSIRNFIETSDSNGIGNKTLQIQRDERWTFELDLMIHGNILDRYGTGEILVTFHIIEKAEENQCRRCKYYFDFNLDAK